MKKSWGKPEKLINEKKITIKFEVLNIKKNHL